MPNTATYKRPKPASVEPEPAMGEKDVPSPGFMLRTSLARKVRLLLLLRFLPQLGQLLHVVGLLVESLRFCSELSGRLVLRARRPWHTALPRLGNDRSKITSTVADGKTSRVKTSPPSPATALREGSNTEVSLRPWSVTPPVHLVAGRVTRQSDDSSPDGDCRFLARRLSRLKTPCVSVADGA